MALAVGRVRTHNIWSRNIFPFSEEELRLYLPFWQEDTQGSPIISYDQYHHSCTVVGTTFNPNVGRIFDGLNDEIVLDNETGLDFERTDPFHFLAWIKGTKGSDTHVIFSKNETGSTLRGYAWRIANTTGKMQLYLWSNVEGSNFALVNGATDVLDGTWHFISVKNDGTGTAAGLFLRVDGVDDVDNRVGTLTATVKNNIVPTIGGREQGDQFLKATLGKLLVYGRSLSVAEEDHIGLVTQGRWK